MGRLSGSKRVKAVVEPGDESEVDGNELSVDELDDDDLDLMASEGEWTDEVEQGEALEVDDEEWIDEDSDAEPGEDAVCGRALIEKALGFLDIGPGFAGTADQQVDRKRQPGVIRRFHCYADFRLSERLAQRGQHFRRGRVHAELDAFATGVRHRPGQLGIESDRIAEGHPAHGQPAALERRANGYGVLAGMVENAVHKKEMPRA